jgi:hypothetical protein
VEEGYASLEQDCFGGLITLIAIIVTTIVKGDYFLFGQLMGFIVAYFKRLRHLLG